MKTPRICILGLTLVATACSDAADDVLGPRLMGDAVAAIPPTNNTACDKFWVGATNGNWTDPARWNPAGVPTASSSVCINVAGTYTVTVMNLPADTSITVDILALTVGGAGASPTLRFSNNNTWMNIAEGVLIEPSAVLNINNTRRGVINAGGTITNNGTLSVTTCNGCAFGDSINADIINNAAWTVATNANLPVMLGKVGGQYQNTGTLTLTGPMTIPPTAGGASFSQDGGVITGGNASANIFKVQSGAFSMNGGKARTRNGVTNLKPIVIVEGANLVINPTFADSAVIGVLASSTTTTSITGSIPSLVTLWMAGPENSNPGTISFADVAPTNNGHIRLGTIDTNQGTLTIGGSGRLTNASTIDAPTGGATPVFHFGLEVTNNSTIGLGEDMTFEKAGGTYYNAGTISGAATLHVNGATLVSTSTGTVTPTGSAASPNFRVDGGRLVGVGTVGDVTLVNGGTLEPGTSAGVLTANSATVNTGTSLKIELGGTPVGTGYDQLALILGPTTPGAMDVTEINGFLSGVCGQQFDVLTHNLAGNYGLFPTITGLAPAANRALRVVNDQVAPKMVTLYGYDPTVKISVAPNPVAIAEGGTGVPYAVCLDGVPALSAGQTVTVTPTPNAQVTVSPPFLTFTSSNWQAPQFFTVTAVDDSDIEGNHSGTVTHASASSVAAYNGVIIASLTANITDNDAPPQSPTTTSVGSSANPSTFGQSVIFTATVASGAGTPDGTVQFKIDGSNVGSPVTLVSGQATFGISSLSVANHPVEATYSGSTGFLTSNGSLTNGQTVNPAPTSTAVSSNNNPSDVGESVTFTATVSSSGGVPTGAVQFKINGLNFGTPAALVSGQATLTTSALSSGTHTVEAFYNGSTNFGVSNGSLAGGQVVTLNATTTTVGSSQNPSTFGQSVTFTATVSSGAGTPSGSVQFSIDGNPAGTPVSLSGGQATHVTSSLTVGNHTVSVTYVGNATYAGSSGSLSGGQVVNAPAAASTTTTVQSSLNPSNVGQSVTFTASVSSGGGTPTGAVQFNIDGSDAGSPVTLVGGQATLATTSLIAGTHPVTATFIGNASFAGSNGSLSGGQVVNLNATTTGVSSSQNPSTFGQSVTFTATVSSSAGTPSGSVQFSIDGSPVGVPVPLAGGQATHLANGLSGGNHSVSATYVGNTTHAGSGGSLGGGQTVNPAATSTGVSSSLNPSNVGQSVTFTATVTSGAGTPTGSVQFAIDGGNAGGPVPLNASGVATHSTSSLTAGSHPVTATYIGNANFGGSNGSLSGGQVVNLNATTTGISSSQNPSTFGQPVTFTATVSSGAGTPTGSVQFSIDGSPVGVPVALAGGQATHVASTLAVGNHPVNATYVGNTSHAGSSGSLGSGQTVNPAATSTAVSSNGNPSTIGQLVTFTATVTSGGGVPTGMVQFTIDGSDVGAPVTLNGSGQAQLSTSSLSLGNHPVQAAYSASGNFTSSAGSLGGGQTVIATPTTTTVASIVTDDPQYSDKVTLRATVTPHQIGSDQLTGNVFFYIGAATVTCGPTVPPGSIGNDAIAAADDGVGQIDYQALYIPGSHTITACFYSTSAQFSNSGDTESIALGRENAALSPGATYGNAFAASGTIPVASFTLQFVLRESNPEPDVNAGAMPGDIDNAGVTVNLVAVGSGSNNKTVVCSPSAAIATPPAYADARTFTCNFTNVAVDAYEVDADVTGNYYSGGKIDALTVYDPSAGYTTGGGTFVYPGTSDVVSFGLTMNVPGKKQAPRGNFIAIRQKANGDICRAKSNDIDAPAVSGNTASFSGKGNYVCTTPNGTTYDGIGNQTILGWMQDNGDPGKWGNTPDRVWIRMAVPNSALSMPMPASTNAQPLTGGNVKVH